MSTFGNTTASSTLAGTGFNTGDGSATKFTLSEVAFVTSMSIYGRMHYSGNTQLVRMAIYADNAGALGALQGVSEEISLGYNGGSDKWWNANITVGSLPAGDYWLLAWFGAYVGSVFDGKELVDAARDIRTKALGTYSSTADPTTPGGAFTYTQAGYALCIYATYTLGPPDAPSLTSPIGGATIAVEPSQTFSWTFSSSVPGDTQSAYDLRYRVIGAGSWTTVSGTTAQSRVFAANTFTDATDYEWQVRTAGALGVYGPYSASALFSAEATPGAPTITDPTNGGTIAAATYDVDWTIADQDAYQLRTVADVTGDPDTGTVYTDTGTVTTAVARTKNIAFATNNRYEHIQLRIYHGALWGPWASIRVAVAYTAPAVPLVSIATSDVCGDISLLASHPTPTGSQPTVAWIDIYRSEAGAVMIRIAKEQPPTAVWYDYTVASGVDYTYIVRAVGTTGTTADSAETV